MQSTATAHRDGLMPGDGDGLAEEVAGAEAMLVVPEEVGLTVDQPYTCRTANIFR